MTEAALPPEATGPGTAQPGPASDRSALPVPAPVVEAAIAWALRLDYNIPSDADHRAFEDWLKENPLHATAWQRVHSIKGLQQELAGVPSQLAQDVLQTARSRHDQRRLVRRRNALKLLSLCGIAIAAGWTASEYAPWQRLLADASTGIGEQQTLRLTDGSVVTLNTDSAVSIDFADSHRTVVLHRGEILIATGADAAVRRPFWVRTPFGRLQALGTRFVVRLERRRALVSVQEGAVALHSANGLAPTVVQAGEGRFLTEDGTAPPAALPFEADGWADGVISGRNMRLQDLLAELSRYRPGRIVCDPRVADRRLSGVFQVRETDQALQFIAQTQGLRLDYRTRFWVTLAPEGGR